MWSGFEYNSVVHDTLCFPCALISLVIDQTSYPPPHLFLVKMGEPEPDESDLQAKGDFAFLIPLGKASEAEQKVAQDLKQELESGGDVCFGSGADVEDATTYVEHSFQAFMAKLPEEVFKACSEASLREQWMAGHYFTTLRSFVFKKRSAFRPHVQQSVLGEESWVRAEAMHQVLRRRDEEPLKSLMAHEFDMYISGFDETLQNTFAEQSSRASLEKIWLGKVYVEVLEMYTEHEKDKFEVAACVALMEPEKQSRVQQLARKLRSKDEGGVSKLTNEMWDVYSSNLDAAITSSCTLEALRDTWMAANYEMVLKTYVSSKSFATSPPLLAGKRSAASASVATSLSPAKTLKKVPQPPARGAKDAPVEVVFTAIEDLGRKMASSHSVVGLVLASCLTWPLLHHTKSSWRVVAMCLARAHLWWRCQSLGPRVTA